MSIRINALMGINIKAGYIVLSNIQKESFEYTYYVHFLWLGKTYSTPCTVEVPNNIFS